MTLTNNGLVAYCQECLSMGDGTVYVYGSIGQKLTSSLITDRAKAYPKVNTSTRVALFKKILNTGKTVYAFDCVGLIKSYIWGGYGKVKYNSKHDVSANGMYQVATKKGNISSIPEVKGLFVQMDGHIGVYVGNGYVIECTPNKTFAKQTHGAGGVCKTKLSARKWTHWGYIPWIEYEPDKSIENKPETPKKGNTIDNLGLVEYLNYIGVDSSKENRKVLAEKFGIENYSYTAEQNMELLKLCKKNLSFKVKISKVVVALNYRKGAGTNFGILGAYKKDTVVKINEVKENWGKTPEGWINLDYTEVVAK